MQIYGLKSIIPVGPYWVASAVDEVNSFVAEAEAAVVVAT